MEHIEGDRACVEYIVKGVCASLCAVQHESVRYINFDVGDE